MKPCQKRLGVPFFVDGRWKVEDEKRCKYKNATHGEMANLAVDVFMFDWISAIMSSTRRAG
jgi:hypothetical protein